MKNQKPKINHRPFSIGWVAPALLDKGGGKNQKGFTLIELLTAVTIFSLIVGISSGIFVQALKAQRRFLANQELLDQSSYLMEYLSRALRMARNQADAKITCLTEEDLNYEIPSSYRNNGSSYRNNGNENSGWGIKFINYEGNTCQEFYWDKNTKRLMENRNNNPGYPLPLTSPSLKITSLEFNLSGKSRNDDLQPRVSFFIEIVGKEGVKIHLQTTISQRNPDI